jgi:protein-tyrosine kinase
MAHRDEPGAAAPEDGWTRPRQSLDVAVLAHRGLLAPGIEDGPLAEAFRMLARQVAPTERSNGAAAAHRVVLVTSALPAEGKTFVAANLALAIAREPGRRVLLVDADMHRPAIADRLGLSAERGLSDLLADPTLDLADIAIPLLSPDGLAILAAGRRRPGAGGHIASHPMRAFLAARAGRADGHVTILDSPPLLAASQTAELAAQADQVLLVIAAESTGADAIDAALDLLARGRTVGLVLNRARQGVGGADYARQGRWFVADPARGRRTVARLRGSAEASQG